MSCKEDTIARLQAQRENWGNELTDMLTGAIPNNPLVNTLAGLAGDLGSYITNQAFQAANELLGNVQNIAFAFVNLFTSSDEIQIALYARLNNTLKEYLQNRRIATRKIRTTAQNLISILNSIAPRTDLEIERKVRSAKSSVDSAIRLLDASERGLQESPPTIFRGYTTNAGLSVERAINVLGGTTGSEITGLDDIARQLGDNINNRLQSTEERYRLAAAGISAGIKDFARALNIDLSLWSIGSSLTGINTSLFGPNDNLKSLSSKVKSTAKLLLYFPFHITALNRIASLEAARLHTIKTQLEDISSSMAEELSNIEEGRSYTSIYGHQVGWVALLNSLSLLLGNSRQSTFSPLSQKLESLANDLKVIRDITDYLSQPNYIKDMNQFVDRIDAACIGVIPSLLAAPINPRAHVRAINGLNDIILLCNLMSSEDSRLLSLLNKLNTSDNDNPIVSNAMKQLDDYEEHIGSVAAHILGLDDGTVVAKLASMLIPPATALTTDFFADVSNGIFSQTLTNNLFPDGVFADINIDVSFSGAYADLTSSWSNTLECFQSYGGIVKLPSPKVLATEDQVSALDAEKVAQTANLYNDFQIKSTCIVEIDGDDLSQDKVLLENPYEDYV